MTDLPAHWRGQEGAERYFEAAARLVGSINDNHRDLAFVAGGGRLVHLIDTNALRICLNPEREAGSLNIFPLADRGLVKDIADLTSHLILTEKLSDQVASPLYILGPHARELKDFLEATLSEIKSGEKDSEATREHIRTIGKYRDLLKAGSLAPREGSIWFTRHAHILRRGGPDDSEARALPPSSLKKSICAAILETRGDKRANAARDAEVIADHHRPEQIVSLAQRGRPILSHHRR
jgi:hypothetical protein